MTVHHLDCATMCPLGGSRMVAHCLLVEGARGLVLVDTGFGTADIADPSRLGRLFHVTTRPLLDPRQTALSQVRALGRDPADVRDIVVTHLDLDHAGGLADFPGARVHLLAAEHRAAHRRATVLERKRYLPAQWAHGPRWELHEPTGQWMGAPAAPVLDDPEVLLVPLAGHTRGHSGVAVRREDGGWLLHCGDSYFFHGQTDPERPHCPKPLALADRLLAVDNRARVAGRARLRELRRTRSDQVTLFCAHDPHEFAALSSPGAPEFREPL
ncbi:MBL fold metallo-hydrolase [Wenjunlia tyrosinilytica]|uniref:MBL fold metallo-hydrolase n=1 Tax=Wenjunlia tyrosinilytica TaxID=1544741 RepID=A0A917ZPM6_9ACTN|nr:MBL fold metallo-hydrolase [Wenjunlia tyrosinilytica]GGO87748.1 MBL fold metallo-hydrolase [Wenjunlia tyrosinilytica]